MATDSHDREPSGPSRPSGPTGKPAYLRQFSLALELPVVLVASVLIGGGIGHLMDRWLHKDSLFTLILGALGFAAGMTDVVRRLLGEENREGAPKDKKNGG